MTLTQLKYIIALSEWKHFAKAANRLYITQPTLSIQIHKLEEELGCMIFDRSKQPVEPTLIGKRIIEQARKVLLEAGKIKNIAQETGGTSIKGVLRIAVLPSIAPYLLPLFIPAFHKKYPNVQLKIREIHNYQILGRLKKDTSDLGITTANTVPNNYYKDNLYEEPIAVYIHPKHPLYQKKHIEITDIINESLILSEDGKNMLYYLQKGKTEKVPSFSEKEKNTVYQSVSIHTILNIIDKKGGITLVPKLATLLMDEEQKTHIRYFKTPAPKRQIVFLTQRGFQKYSLMDILKTEILEGVMPFLNT